MRFLKVSLLALAFALPVAASAACTTDVNRPEAALVHDGFGSPAIDWTTENRAPSSYKDPVLSNGDGAQAPADIGAFRNRHWN